MIITDITFFVSNISLSVTVNLSNSNWLFVYWKICNNLDVAHCRFTNIFAYIYGPKQNFILLLMYFIIAISLSLPCGHDWILVNRRQYMLFVEIFKMGNLSHFSLLVFYAVLHLCICYNLPNLQLWFIALRLVVVSLY